MEAIGQLAGGIAHDFNNLLTVILGHSEFLLGRVEPDNNRRERIEEIRKAAERAAWLTNQLLAFTRNQLLEPTVLRFDDVLDDMDGILRRVLGEDVDLEVLLAPNLGWVKVDRGQLQQIVLNLAGNARDAMPKGGRLRIEAINVSVKRGSPKPQPYLKLGEYVAIVVRDTGVGMDKVTRARIFEPFFTTKEKGKGTGLGLATVYGIVKQSGGYIWVDAGEDGGSVFHTLLPRVPEPSRQSVVQKIFDFHSNGETILLVEDDPAVRKMAAEVLRAAGYRALVAPSGKDALRLAADLSFSVDLLLTDVVMPGMTGPALADKFAVDFPRTRVLYMSGYTDDALGNHGLRGKTRHVLQKPFTHEMLVRRVHEALELGRRH
jgi:two-component system cell cycle sensor histidine kinase/response regulator CckA